MDLPIEGGEWRHQEVQGEISCEGISIAERYWFYWDFSHIVKLTIITCVLSIVAAEDLHLDQLDVKTAFLHGDLGGGHLYSAATGVYHVGWGAFGLQAQEKSPWLETSS